MGNITLLIESQNDCVTGASKNLISWCEQQKKLYYFSEEDDIRHFSPLRKPSRIILYFFIITFTRQCEKAAM